MNFFCKIYFRKFVFCKKNFGIFFFVKLFFEIFLAIIFFPNIFFECPCQSTRRRDQHVQGKHANCRSGPKGSLTVKTAPESIAGATVQSRMAVLADTVHEMEMRTEAAVVSNVGYGVGGALCFTCFIVGLTG